MPPSMSTLVPPVKRSSSSDVTQNAKTHIPRCPQFRSKPSPTKVLTGDLVGIKQHPDFWFEDGNLILIANREMAFRIYAGLLASQSDIFEGMFDIASSNADELFDGCPVVHVYDTPGEFAHFLRVLIPKKSRSFHWTPKDTPLTFDHSAAVVRLSHKYGIPDLRDQAINVIQSDAFPPSQPHVWRRYPNPTLDVQDIHAIGAVNIARLVDLPTLLYPALYRCAVLGSTVLDGWTRDDGEVEHLTPADLRLCMDAHAALARENIAIFAATFEDATSPACKNTRECRAGIRALEDVVLREEFGGRQDVLNWTDDNMRIEKRAETLGVCKCCREMLKARQYKMQLDGWKRLPQIFGAEVKTSDDDEDEDVGEDEDEEEN